MVIVAVGVVVPLALLVALTTQRLRRAGEDLLRRQLESSLGDIERVIQDSWRVHRGELLLLTENDVVRHALGGPGRLTTRESRFLEDAFRVVQPIADEVVFCTATGAVRWRIAPDPGLAPHLELLPGSARRPRSRLGAAAISLPIEDLTSHRRIGEMVALLRVTALIQTPAALGTAGASVSIEDSSGATLVEWRASRDAAAASTTGSRQMTVARALPSLPLHLVAHAPLQPFVAPFERSATRAIAVYAVILGMSLSIAAMLTAGATRSLRALAAGADAVGRGDFERHIDVHAPDEIGRVAAAFNTMMHALRRTLREASQRNALAAVGEFAAELAHEVRNPLTSVRLDLQRLQERLPEDPKLRDPLARALSAVERLNRTVTGALRVARSGHVRLEPVQLAAALEPAVQAAAAICTAREIDLHPRLDACASVRVCGDVDALTQLFTNILLNAAEAIERRGRIDVSAEQDNGVVCVRIADSGPGLPAEILRELGQPLHPTTKRGGTGLGLTIAQRIASAHGGHIEFASVDNRGTTVTITLPRDRSQKASEGRA